MIVLILLLYTLLSVFDAGIIGGVVAFLFSRPSQIITTKRLFTFSLIAILIQDFLFHALFLPLDLTIITKNEALVQIMGTADLSDAVMPSLSLFSIISYVIEVGVAVYCGSFLIRKHYQRYYGEKISSLTHRSKSNI